MGTRRACAGRRGCGEGVTAPLSRMEEGSGVRVPRRRARAAYPYPLEEEEAVRRFALRVPPHEISVPIAYRRLAPLLRVPLSRPRFAGPPSPAKGEGDMAGFSAPPSPRPLSRTGEGRARPLTRRGVPRRRPPRGRRRRTARPPPGGRIGPRRRRGRPPCWCAASPGRRPSWWREAARSTWRAPNR